MFGEISYLRNCILVALLILSVLAIRCLSETTTRTDRISLNGSLSDGQTLVSMSKKFMLGFFRPGASSYRYVGIWYNNVPKRTVVWVANRNSPVRDSLGIRKFDNSGNLIVVDGRGSSFTVAHGVRVEDVEAVILDSGNFVLRSIASHSKIIWQSFDFPADTWLPGMNITVGTSRERKLLTSWKSYDDPAMGDYSFGPGVVNASQLIIWWKGNIFWTSARWNGDIYSLIPDLTSIGIIPVVDAFVGTSYQRRSRKPTASNSVGRDSREEAAAVSETAEKGTKSGSAELTELYSDTAAVMATSKRQLD